MDFEENWYGIIGLFSFELNPSLHYSIIPLLQSLLQQPARTNDR